MHNLAYRKDIDGLRALAVLSVVIYHADKAFLPGGYIGVDIFFVLSGYLITGIIARSLHAGDFSFLEFYKRRVRRIFPALAVVLLASLGAGWYALLDQDLTRLGKHTYSAALFISNITLFNEKGGYFDTSAELKPLLHLWSLAIEEQFYLLWPVILLLTWKLRRSLRAMCFILGGASLIACLAVTQTNPTAAFFMPFTRFWELLAGALLVLHEMKTPQTDTRYQNAGAVMGLCLIVLALCLFNDAQAFPGWRAIFPVLGTCLLLATSQSFINRKIFSARLAVFFGLISYPLYLWHWPLLAYKTILAQSVEMPAYITPALVFLAILLSAATYYALEKPLRFGSHARNKALGLLAALLAIGGIGYHIYSHDGMPERFLSPAAQVQMQALEKTPFDEDCKDVFENRKRGNCRLAKGDAALDTVMFGDSHAHAFHPGLAKAYLAQGKSFMTISKAACPPLMDITMSLSHVRKDMSVCTKVMQRGFDWALHNPDIKTVILAGRGTMYISEKGVLGQGRQLTIGSELWPDLKTKEQIYEAALHHTLQKLEAAKKRVILVLETPEIGFQPSSCLKTDAVHLLGGGQTHACGAQIADVDAQGAEYRALVRRVLKKHPKVMTFDPRKSLCNKKECRAVGDDGPLYFDSNHLSAYGAVIAFQGFDVQ